METSSLKRIVNKYTETSLIIRILIGMAIGVVLALAVPQFTGIKILVDGFLFFLSYYIQKTFVFDGGKR